MTTADTLEQIRTHALHNTAFRTDLLKTRASNDSISDFCRVCRQHGFELYEMELIAFGEETYAAMKRSTNGGGENSPMLEGEDDYYEMLMAELEWKES